MNPFVFACIAPHGAEIIEDLSPSQPALMERTRRSLEELGRFACDAAPDVLVVLTPHGTRADGQFTITDSELVRGSVEANDATVPLERRVDRAFAREVAREATEGGVRVALLNFGVSEGPLSCLPLDWGAIVPLHFMPDVPVVVINPPRGRDFEEHVRFGEAIARAGVKSGSRVALIASCDWSHTHDATGPYGFHEAAARLDAQVVEHVRDGNLEALATFDEHFVEDAKPDGLWQSLVLAGAIPRAARRVAVLSYEAPTYFGLLCAHVSAVDEPS